MTERQLGGLVETADEIGMFLDASNVTPDFLLDDLLAFGRSVTQEQVKVTLERNGADSVQMFPIEAIPKDWPLPTWRPSAQDGGLLGESRFVCKEKR